MSLKAYIQFTHFCKFVERSHFDESPFSLLLDSELVESPDIAEFTFGI